MKSIKDIINGFGGVAADVAGARDGQIALANAGTQLPPPHQFLTQFAVRYAQENNSAEARQRIAPTCGVVEDGRVFEYRYWPYDQDVVTVDYDALRRAPGGDFQAVGDKSELRSGTLDEIGLCVAAEKRHLDEITNYREMLVRKMVGIIERATLIRALSLFEDFADEVEIDLTGDNPQPDAQIREAASAALVRPNRALFGVKAWDLRCAAYEGQLSAGALRAADTPEQLGARLGLDVFVPNGRKAAADGTFPRIFDDKILLAFGSDGTSTEDMSNIKTFRPRDGYEVYESDHPQGRKKLITVHCTQGLQVTSTLGAVLCSLKTA